MTRIRQRFAADKLDDVAGALRAELVASGVSVKRGAHIAIAVGSRGIANLPLIVRETVGWVKAQGGEPFIVPAMGSHGGATADGQRAVLEGYGVTEAATGAPIVSSMDVVELPRGELEVPVYFDKQAAAADGVIVINRIKPHTSFHGPYESGLMKMLAVGLGKHAGTRAIHQLGVTGLRDTMPRVARQILQHGKILLGVGIIENAYDETTLVRAIPAAQIPDKEPDLLARATAAMPSLPMEELDILIVDEIGKNISGTGMDTNIIGRLKIHGQPEPENPRIRIIAALDLSTASHGNAYGVGLADIITRRLFAKIDFSATNANITTTGFLERAKMPPIAETDRDALATALRGCAPLDPSQARIIRIRNTLHLGEIHVSPAVLNAIGKRGNIEVVGPVGELFRGDDLAPFVADNVIHAG
jgi:hypothetical protein